MHLVFSDHARRHMRARGITTAEVLQCVSDPSIRIAGSGNTVYQAHGSGLGVHRGVVEGCFALLHWFRRLRIRWDISDDIHEAFLSLGCSIICWRRLQRHSIC